ncbi:MAG: histidinol dehydrogenase [Pyrinomonadaceae bacterium]
MLRVIEKTDLDGRKAMLGKIKSRSVALNRELLGDVAAIIDDVRQRGDRALVDYAARFDGVRLRPEDLRIEVQALHDSARQVDQRVSDALREAIQNIRAFHKHQVEQSWEFTPEVGVTLGQRVTPIERAGVYVPGGTAAYPSSVVMNVVPAQLAGVERIVVTTPPRTIANPAIAAALVELNVTEVYAVGGAQAIAALAFGTETVPRVDKITGPGNKYVAAAKKQVFGMVGIDSIAGPTEIVVVADEAARADFVAADLLAQAEHGEDSSALLITTSEVLAYAVTKEVDRQIGSLARRQIIEKSLSEFGAIIIVNDLAEASALVNNLAPEHLQIVVSDDQALARGIKHAGAIFLGSFAPAAAGDYFAGPNHILPTGGAARFSSALGVYDFVKRTSILRYSAAGLGRSAEKIVALAEAEGFDAHARSAGIRVS